MAKKKDEKGVEEKEKVLKYTFPTESADLLQALTRANDALYVVYHVKADIISRLVGGTPRLLEAIYALIDARVKAGKISPEEGGRIRDTVREEHEEREQAQRILAEVDLQQRRAAGEEIDPENLPTTTRAVEASWNTFWQDVRGLYLEARVIKSTLRDVFSALQLFDQKNRKKTGHNFGLYIEAPTYSPHPDRVYLYRNGVHIQRADCYEDRPVLIKGPSPRTAIKRVDVIQGREEGEQYGCQFGFKVKVLRDGPLTEPDVINGLALLMDRGLGAMTSQGCGKWTPLEFQRVGVGTD
jgi:polyhydroxyalkanoate synthesis regulator phasin